MPSGFTSNSQVAVPRSNERSKTMNTNRESCPDRAQSANGKASKAEAYSAFLDTWWPRGAPLPIVLPWLGVGTSRRAVSRALMRHVARLPDLPVTTGEVGLDPANIERIVDFVVRLDDSGQLMGAGSSCNPCDGKGGVECDDAWCEAQAEDYCSDLGGVVSADFDKDMEKCSILCTDDNDAGKSVSIVKSCKHD